jgi:hypothetical protein
MQRFGRLLQHVESVSPKPWPLSVQNPVLLGTPKGLCRCTQGNTRSELQLGGSAFGRSGRALPKKTGARKKEIRGDVVSVAVVHRSRRRPSKGRALRRPKLAQDVFFNRLGKTYSADDLWKIGTDSVRVEATENEGRRLRIGWCSRWEG